MPEDEGPALSDPASNQGSTPNPDPTLLTIDALRREIGRAENFLLAKIEAESDLTEERLRRIDERWGILEERRKEQKEDTKEAVDKAFEAAKELVDAAFASSEKAILKAEVSIEKRADTTYVALTSLQQMLGNLMTRKETEQRFEDHLERIQVIQNRITVIESMKMGQAEQKTETRQISATAISLAGLGIAILVALVAVISYAAAS